MRARVRGYLREQRFDDGQRGGGGRRAVPDRPEHLRGGARRGARASSRGRARTPSARAARLRARARSSAAGNVVSDSVLDARARRPATPPPPRSRAPRRPWPPRELNLSYCTVQRADRGPIGRALVDVGNLVGESGQDTVLAQIVQIDPIHVYFAPTERDRLDVLRGAREGRIPRSARASRSSWRLGDGTPYPHPGVVDYVDPTIDADARHRDRARARAESGRRAEARRVRARGRRVPGRPRRRAGAGARGAGAAGRQLRAGREGPTTRSSTGACGRREHAGLRRVIEGLAADERVIVDGAQKARPGSQVAPRELPGGAPGAAGASR